MDNLAGRPAEVSDRFVAIELAQVGIRERPVPPSVEVFTTKGGEIGHFKLWRAWSYWVVNGLVPLDMAEDLYASPGGRRDVRVAGNCTRPAPADWARWYAPDGRIVLDRDNEREARRYADMPGTIMQRIGAQILKCCLFADVPRDYPDAQGYIEGYHIDSLLGLQLFAEACARHGLDGADLPPRHARVKLVPGWDAKRLEREETKPSPVPV